MSRPASPPLESLRALCASPPEQPSPAWLRQAGAQVMEAILDDHLDMPEAGVGTSADRATMEALFNEPPPEQGMDFTRLLADVRDKILHHALRPNHPRFLAFIPSAPSFASILGDCLAGGANLFAGVWLEAAAATQIEITVLDWFKQLLGLPASTQGLLTSGGSEANLIALVAARERLTFPDRARSVLYASEERHWSIDRAVNIIGMGPDQLCARLPCDTNQSLRVDALEEAVKRDREAGRIPWLILANAGATNTGSIDPLAELAGLRDRHQLWLHVDAAYGWPAVLTAEGQAALAGIERADSITLDPHKWFAQTFEAGCLLVRQGDLLTQAFQMRPAYLQDVTPAEDEINFCDRGIALTRRFRALKIWFSIKLLGLAWFRKLVAHSCALADYAQALLERNPAFEITSPRRLSIVCFRYIPDRPQLSPAQTDALQIAIAEELRRTGRAFLSTTRLHGRNTLRFCLVNARTTAADVEEIVRLLTDIGIRLAMLGK